MIKNTVDFKNQNKIVITLLEWKKFKNGKVSSSVIYIMNLYNYIAVSFKLF